MVGKFSEKTNSAKKSVDISKISEKIKEIEKENTLLKSEIELLKNTTNASSSVSSSCCGAVVFDPPKFLQENAGKRHIFTERPTVAHLPTFNIDDLQMGQCIDFVLLANPSSLKVEETHATPPPEFDIYTCHGEYFRSAYLNFKTGANGAIIKTEEGVKIIINGTRL